MCLLSWMELLRSGTISSLTHPMLLWLLVALLVAVTYSAGTRYRPHVVDDAVLEREQGKFRLDGTLHDDELFARFVSHFNRQYSDASEHQHRRAVFQVPIFVTL